MAKKLKPEDKQKRKELRETRNCIVSTIIKLLRFGARIGAIDRAELDKIGYEIETITCELNHRDGESDYS